MFKKGDKVRFLNENEEGVVLSIASDGMVMVLTSDGFEFPVMASDLLLHKEGEMMEDIFRQGRIHRAVKRKEGFTISGKAVKKEQRPAYEIDLHIHQLVPSTRGMSNYDMLRIQLDHFVLKLEEALRNGHKMIIVIHGQGRGVLKKEIHSILEQYEGVFYRDAAHLGYGHGATEISML